MRKEIDEILVDLKLGKLTITNAGDKLLLLFNVMKNQSQKVDVEKLVKPYEISNVSYNEGLAQGAKLVSEALQSQAFKEEQIIQSLTKNHNENDTGRMEVSTDRKTNIVLPNGDRVDLACFNPTKEERREAEANAQRIVKAVNMHDELIECIKDLSERLNLDGYDQDNLRLKNAMNLIKQAEQK